MNGPGRDLRIDRFEGLVRAALVEGGRLTDLIVDFESRPSRIGAVYVGRVLKVLPGRGAFVELGEGRPGFLGGERRQGDLRVGRVLPVQVKADPVGDKGPALTADIRFAGRFFVHMPLGRGVTASRRGDPATREALKRIGQEIGLPGGWVVRSSALSAPSEVLAADAARLAELGRAVPERGDGAPRLLVPAPQPLERAAIELASQPVDAATIDDPALFRFLKDWCARWAPDLAERVAAHGEDLPLFELDDLEGQFDALTSRRAPLPGGGWLSVETTEALTAVDVNGGERADALRVNLDAAREVARQLRLRNVGGVVVVDFVNMAGAGDRERLLEELRRAVADDPAATHIYGVTALGLVEMTRARRGPALHDLLRRERANDERR